MIPRPIRVSIPSKTFILGEYAVLRGAPALVVATQPHFEVFWSAQDSLKFHPQSPAGRLLRGDTSQSPLNYKFVDPHGGRGGFGGSTAEFIAADVLIYGYGRELQKVWRRYLDVFSEDRKPSGADLVAQLMGGIVEFRNAGEMMATPRLWNWPKLDMLAFRTLEKTSTHEHLSKELSISSELCQLADQGAQAILNPEPDVFIQIIIEYQLELERLGFLSVSTRGILEVVRGLDGVRAAKGCGAMGSDVVLVLCERDRSGAVIEALKRLGLTYVSGLDDLSLGTSVEYRAGEVETAYVS